jgi:hypothetical protein
MATNFNTNPYYDDFDEKKNYHRILFRPGYAVQARELTQLQTQIQDSIKKFGQNIFTNGTVVTGAGRTFDREVISIKLESTYSGTAVDTTLFPGKIIVGETSKTKATVVLALPVTPIDPLTFIVKIISGTAFTAGERIYTDDTDSYSATISAGSFLAPAMTFNIDSGVFFIDGSFVYLEAQTIAVSKYDNTSSASIGVQVVESIITSNEDESLLDAAQGTPNYAAPGADRYQIALDLITKAPIAAGNYTIGKTYQIVTLGTTDFTAIGADANTTNTTFVATGVGSGSGTAINVVDDYIEIARIVSGNLVVNNNKTVYAELGKTLARRTYDESGDYTVRPWPIQILDNGDATFTVALDPGKGYVKGFEFETISQQQLSLPKARTTAPPVSEQIPMSFGNFVYVSNLNGIFNTNDPINGNSYTAVELHNVTKSNPPSSGTKIGTARVRFIKWYSGVAGTAGVYKLYLFNIVMNSSSVYFKSVKSILTNSGSYGTILGADINTLSQVQTTNATLGVVAGDAILSGQDQPSLVYALPDQFISSLVNASNVKDAQFYSQKVFAVTSISGTSCSIGTTGYERLIGSVTPATVSSGDKLTHYHMVRSDGTVVDLSAATLTLTNPGSASSAQTGTFASLPSSTYTGAYVVATTYETDTVVGSNNIRTKTLSVYQYKVISSPNTTLGGKDEILASDIYDVQAIYNTGSTNPTSTLGSGFNTTTGAVTWGAVTYTNVTSNYAIDNGQRDEIYDHGNIQLIGSSPASTDYIVVVYRNFSHTGFGYISRDSYSVDYASIPTFTSPSNGLTYQLRDCIDFRPRRADSSSTALGNGLVPNPDYQLITSYKHYIGRFDKIIATSGLQFINQQGIPDVYPLVPEDVSNGMTLYILAIPPYTANVSDIQIQPIQNKRYTMRDIGKLETRVSNLEYYTQLSLLEQQTKATSFTDTNNVEKFKNGFAVDPFSSADIFTGGDTTWTQRRWGWWNAWFNGSTSWSGAAQNYSDSALADPTNVDFNAAVDPVNQELRAPFTITQSKFNYADDAKGSDNTSLYGSLVALDYTEVVAISQLVASSTINVNPFNVVRFLGSIVLDPPIDNWVDTLTLPQLNSYVTINLPDSTSTTPKINVSYAPGYHGANLYHDTPGASTTNLVTTSSPATSLGTKVVDVQSIPYIRASTVYGMGRGFKPNARLYPFVEGTPISSYCRRMTQLTLQDHVGTLFDDSYGTFERVNYVYPLTFDANGKPATYTIFKTAKAGLYSDPTTANTQRRILSVFQEEVVGVPTPVPSPAVTQKTAGPVFDNDNDSLVKEGRFVPGLTYILHILGTTDWPKYGFTERVNYQASFAGNTMTVASINTRSDGSASGSLAIGQSVHATGVTLGTVITAFVSGRGGTGTYRISNSVGTLTARTVTSFAQGDVVQHTAAAFKGTISGTVLTVQSMSDHPIDIWRFGGTLKVGQTIYDAAGTSYGKITSLGTGTGRNTNGTYNLDTSGSVATSTRFRSIFVNTSTIGTGAASATSQTNPIVTPSPDVISADANKNYIYIMGTKSGGYAKLVDNGRVPFNSGDSLTPDEFGNIAFEFQIPAGKFATGQRTIRLIDDSNNNVNLQDSMGEVKYTANGLTVTKQETLLTTRIQQNQITPVINRQYYDPIAETFLVDSTASPQGIYVTSVDIYFATKDSNLPVTLQIRRTVNGYPSSVSDIPFNEVTLYPSKVNTSTTASLATTFTLSTPLHLIPGEYAVVLITNSSNYNVYISEVGGTVVNGTARITKQPYMGSLFKSQNASTWEADQNKDLMFSIKQAKFATSGTAVFNIKDPLSIKDYHLLNINAGTIIPLSTGNSSNITWSVKTWSLNNAVDSSWTPVNINKDITFNSLRRLAGTADGSTVVNVGSLTSGVSYTILTVGTTDFTLLGSPTNNVGQTFTCNSASQSGTGTVAANSLQLQAVLTTSDTQTSPAIDLNALAVVGAVNTINDLTYTSPTSTATLTSGSNIIENVPKAVFSNINLGSTIAGSGTSPNSIAIAGTVTAIDSYAQTIQVSANATGSGSATNSGLTFTLAETGTIGGGALARYVSKVINLADGFDATNLHVTLDINRPTGTNVYVYYKALPTEATTSIASQSWIQMTQLVSGVAKTIPVSSGNYDFQEYTWYPSGAYTNGLPANAPISPKFNAFQVKIVMTSSDKTLTPRLKNLRVIALDS